jgi:hypothetical protein
MKSKLHVYA